MHNVTTAFFTATSDAGIKATIELPTRDEAKALAAEFPKSLRVTASYGIAPIDGNYRNGSYEYGTINIQVALRADGVNKGTNEAGLRRWRSFRKHCERLGIDLEYRASYANSLSAEEAAAL